MEHIFNYQKVSSRFLSYLIFFVLVSCPVNGQVKQKKLLTVADYHLWSTLKASGISNMGRWVNYSLDYESGMDTLFVRRSDGKKIFYFPKGRSGKFSKENWFACMTAKNKLVLTSLKTGKQETLEEVTDFKFSFNGASLITVSKNAQGKKMIAIRNLNDGGIETITDVSFWRFNKDCSSLAYARQSDSGCEVAIISLDTNKRIVELLFSDAIVSNIVWEKDGYSIAFLLETKLEGKFIKKLAYYRSSDKKLFVLDPLATKGFPAGRHVSFNFYNDVCISEDGERIIFQVLKDSLTDHYSSPTVEIWNGQDKRLYTERKQTGALDEWEKPVVWYPAKDSLFIFMEQENYVLLSGNQKLALSSNIESCEPQWHYTPPRDYYLTDLTTGKRNLWLACHSGERQHTYMSPTANYIMYFKDGNWFSYDVLNNVHRNLTKLIGVAFYDELNSIPDTPDCYGLAGWSSDGKIVFLYDRFDIWEFASDNSSFRRLTQGREKGISFRIINAEDTPLIESFLSVPFPTIIDLNDAIYLKATTIENDTEGYFKCKNRIMEPIVFKSKRVSQLLIAGGAEVYGYVEEDYQHAPNLNLKKGISAKSNLLFQSNLQQFQYQWGRVETINYKGISAEKLKGLLYYPSDYKKGKTYPMVVHIYQKQSQGINEYINPSVYLPDGFNVTNFVTQGYFVLLPDITYTIGTPGDSAVECVEAAVKAVLGMDIVKPDKIGLIGHSFGGYETSYVVTKSKLFATAIAGAPQTDLISGYLDVSENYKKAEFWRYESYTNRMRKPLFEDMENYMYNSPVLHSPLIATPILIWTGTADIQVAESQSMELYLAMRKLGKKVTLLRYPNENHSLGEPDKQADLSLKVAQWYNYYLKDGVQKSWMYPNVNP